MSWCFVSWLVGISLMVLEKIFKVVSAFFLGHYYLKLSLEHGPSFKRVWISFTQRWHLPSLNKNRPSDFKMSQIHFHFIAILFVGKGHDPSYEETWFCLTQWYSMPNLIEIDPGLHVKMTVWKFNKQTHRGKDGKTNGQTTDHRNIQLMWGKKP